MSTHSKAAAKFLADSERVTWHDKALWAVREKRDRMAASVPEWEELRQYMSDVKLHTLSHLADYLEEFERNATANGIHVHWAADASEHNAIVYDILQTHGVERLVKSKSMLSEECGLNRYLLERGVDVVESDLGERIMQFLGQPPSHIVLPAIHVKREEVGRIFEEKLGSEKGNSDPTYLTHEARKSLRQNFLNAQAAMTGVNFAVASTGAFAVCTNEGNADMGTSLAPVHIAIMGLEKIVPDYDALAAGVRLLARSATGQPSTTYTSLYRRPAEGQEMHIVIVDNGRSTILSNPAHRAMLKCLRCGACINTCPVYRRTGGYSYSYFIPGPVGINLGMLRCEKEHRGNVSACSLCHSCQNVCPTKIDLADQIYQWRQTLGQNGLAPCQKKLMSGGIRMLMSSPGLLSFGIDVAHMASRMPHAVLHNGLNPWAKGREMPPFPGETFSEMMKKGKI